MKAVVLGGGFAGLAAASELARQGLAVTLLEQHTDVGGKASEYRADGYRFDTGPHLFTLPDIYRSLFTASDDIQPVTMQALEPLTRYFFPPGRSWDVYFETDHAPKTTQGLSEQEASTYLALRAEAKKLFEGAAPTFLYGSAPNMWDLFLYGLREGLQAHPLKTLPQLLKTYGASEDLEQFFLRFATYFGADPYRAPAILHNIAWVELGQGAFHPVGGIAAVIASLKTLAESRGVDIRCDTPVTRLHAHNKHITSVETSQGQLEADVVVSALDIIRTSQLLGKTSPLAKLAPSLSGFVMLLGVRGESPSLAHHNISFAPDYQREFADIAAGHLPQDPTIYISISSKSAPEDAPAGCENWFILVNAPPQTGASAPFVQADKREQMYASHIIDLLEKRGFDVKRRLEHQHILPPRYLSRFAQFGSIYGVAPHSLMRTIRPKPRLAGVRNLWLAGGTVHPGGGMPLAMLSGKNAAAAVCRHYNVQAKAPEESP
jgi:phytoene desaturase